MAVLNFRDPDTGQFVSLSGGGPPIGVITMFPGATSVPDGWIVCDGRAHGSAELQAIIGSATTPDLKDRFVVGAGATMPAKSTGGLATVTLTGAQTGTTAHNHTAASTTSASHTHTYTAESGGGHLHSSYWANYVERADLSNTQNSEPAALNTSGNLLKSITTTGAEGGFHTHTGTAGNQTGNHTHSMSVGASVAAVAAEAHENQPPFYVMVYIIFGG